MIEISGFAEARERIIICQHYCGNWLLAALNPEPPSTRRHPLPGRTTSLDDRSSEWVPTLAQSSNPFPKSLQWRHLSDIFW